MPGEGPAIPRLFWPTARRGWRACARHDGEEMTGRSATKLDLFPKSSYHKGMEPFSPPRPAVALARPLYYQLIHTLNDLLPPPLAGSPEALCARNHAAIARAAVLLPADGTEVDLAARCIAARAQAEDVLRQLRQHPGDIRLVLRLNAQYGSMVRTSLAEHGRLMRMQALRQKREAIEGAATEDSWTARVAERSMLLVADPDAEPLEASGPAAAPVEVTRVEEPGACVDQRTEKNISENETNSHDAAFETWLREQPWNRGKKGSGKAGRRISSSERVPKHRTPADDGVRTGRHNDPFTTRQPARRNEPQSVSPSPTLRPPPRPTSRHPVQSDNRRPT